MAGKRQHYVPRFLQRGFLNDPNEEAERTWLYRRGGTPRLVGIRAVGVAEYFYSRCDPAGAQTLDDAITTAEGAFSTNLNHLRSAPEGSVVNGLLAATLVVHLVMRTAHIRSVFTDGCTRIVDEMSALYADKSRLRSLMSIDGVQMSAVLRDALDNALHDAPLEQLGIPPILARRMLEFMVRERFDELMSGQTEIISPGLTSALSDLPDRIRDTHNKILTTGFSDTAWISDLELFEWYVVDTDDELILSDCVALAIEEESKDYVPFLFAGRERTCGVVLPIAAHRLLVGKRADDVELDLTRYNVGAAACSDSFFIARTSTAGVDVVHLIGERASEQLTRSINEAVAELEGKHGDVIDLPVSEADLTIKPSAVTEKFSFSLNLLGFPDVNVANLVVKLTKTIVQELGRTMPLGQLDGITFAADYLGALRTLDRGDPTLPPAESGRTGYGQAVAKAVTVQRSGTVKIHLVIDASIGVALTSDAEETRMRAMHLLAKKLAYVAFSTEYERALVSRPFSPHDAVVSLLYPWSGVTPSAYFTAQASAFIDPAAGELFADLVVDSLRHAKKIVREARLAYRADADMEKLLSVSLPATSAVLKHFAEWLGHRDGLPDEQPYSGDDLLLRLQDENLEEWLELFARDLRMLYQVEGTLDIVRILNLSQHMERLLWTMQIYPFPNEDGEAYIWVPFGDDLAELESRAMNVR